MIINSNSCMHTNDDSGHPFDHYVGKAKQISIGLLIINTSLIYQWSIGIIGIDLSPIPSISLSVSLSVCPESVLWQNGWLDLDAALVVIGVGQRMGVLDGVAIVEGKGVVLGVNLIVGHPTATNGDFVV